MKAWIKTGLIGVVIGVVLAIVISIFVVVFNLGVGFNHSFLEIVGIFLFVVLLSIIPFFILGAIVGLIVEKFKK